MTHKKYREAPMAIDKSSGLQQGKKVSASGQHQHRGQAKNFALSPLRSLRAHVPLMDRKMQCQVGRPVVNKANSVGTHARPKSQDGTLQTTQGLLVMVVLILVPLN